MSFNVHYVAIPKYKLVRIYIADQPRSRLELVS